MNANNTWRDWQAAQEERMAGISKDMQDLQEEGFIPEAQHMTQFIIICYKLTLYWQ